MLKRNLVLVLILWLCEEMRYYSTISLRQQLGWDVLLNSRPIVSVGFSLWVKNRAMKDIGKAEQN